VFTDAVKRLGAIFSKSKQEEDDDYQDREYDLLNATYGQSKRQDGVFFNLIDLNYDKNGELKELVGVSSAEPPRKTNLVTKTLGATVEEIESAKAENVPAIPANTSSMVGEERLKKELTAYVINVLDRQTTDHNLAAYHEIKDVTPAFNIIGQQIHIIKTEIIGNKDKEGSLIKNL
jgi:hypothetical protein